MREFNKQKYVPCEFKIIDFQVEREFAAGSGGPGLVGAFANANNTNQLIMNRHESGDYQNNEAQYENDGFDWFGNNSQQ